MLTVTLPDGSQKKFDRPVSAYDVAAEIGPGLAKAAVLAEVDGGQVDLHSPLPTAGEVRLRLLTKRDADALAVMRHSAAHVMAQAVMRLFEGVQLAFRPTTGSGFYYDFHLPQPISEEDFPRIEAEMQKIVAADERFERLEMPRDEALKLCEELGRRRKGDITDIDGWPVGGVRDRKSGFHFFKRQGGPPAVRSYSTPLTTTTELPVARSTPPCRSITRYERDRACCLPADIIGSAHGTCDFGAQWQPLKSATGCDMNRSIVRRSAPVSLFGKLKESSQRLAVSY